MSDVLAFSVGDLVVYTSDLTGEQYEAKVIRPTAWNIRWNAWARPDQLRRTPSSDADETGRRPNQKGPSS